MDNRVFKQATNLECSSQVTVRDPREGEPGSRPIIGIRIGEAESIVPLTPGTARELAEALVQLADRYEQKKNLGPNGAGTR